MHRAKKIDGKLLFNTDINLEDINKAVLHVVGIEGGGICILRMTDMK